MGSQRPSGDISGHPSAAKHASNSANNFSTDIDIGATTSFAPVEGAIPHRTAIDKVSYKIKDFLTHMGNKFSGQTDQANKFLNKLTAFLVEHNLFTYAEGKVSVIIPAPTTAHHTPTASGIPPQASHESQVTEPDQLGLAATDPLGPALSSSDLAQSIGNSGDQDPQPVHEGDEEKQGEDDVVFQQQASSVHTNPFTSLPTNADSPPPPP